MSDPIRHHFIPEFYLRQWAGLNGKLFWYYRPHNRVVVSTQHPSSIGFKKYLYTINNKSNPHIIEKKFFSKLDNDAAIVLKKLNNLGNGLVIIERHHLNDTQRRDWTWFIQSLHLRCPHSLNEIDTVLRQQVKENIERAHGATYSARKQSDDPDSVYDYAISDAPDLFADAHKFQLMKLIAHEPLGNYIMNMLWAVIDVSDTPHPLVASDRPYILPCGLLNPSCILGVPISPTRLFLAANNLGTLETLNRQSRRDTIRNSNDLVVRMAVEHVYGSTNDRREFVEKRLRHSNEPPLAGLIMGPG